MTVSVAPHHDDGPDDVDAILAALELDLWESAGRVRALRSAADLTRLTPEALSATESPWEYPGVSRPTNGTCSPAVDRHGDADGPIVSEGWAS